MQLCHHIHPQIPVDHEPGKAEDKNTPSPLDFSLLKHTGLWLRDRVIEEKLRGVAQGLPTSIFLLPVTSIINKKDRASSLLISFVLSRAFSLRC